MWNNLKSFKIIPVSLLFLWPVNKEFIDFFWLVGTRANNPVFQAWFLNYVYR